MSTFDPSRHPRGAGGLFSTVTAAEPPLTLNAPDGSAPEEYARQRAADLLENHWDLELYDYSAEAEDDGFTELNRMAHPDTARGNCWSASGQIIELGADELGADSLQEIVIDSPGRGQHVAILAGYRNGTVVVDYTMRQFDPEAPFPWVGSPGDWEAAVGSATGWEWAPG